MLEEAFNVGDPHQQQHAAVLSDGSTAAQEAEHHDDHADGDHQVDARKRLVRDLKAGGGQAHVKDTKRAKH